MLLLKLLVRKLLHLHLLIQPLNIKSVLIVLCRDLRVIIVQLRVPPLAVQQLVLQALLLEVQLLNLAC